MIRSRVGPVSGALARGSPKADDAIDPPNA